MMNIHQEERATCYYLIIHYQNAINDAAVSDIDVRSCVHFNGTDCIQTSMAWSYQKVDYKRFHEDRALSHNRCLGTCRLHDYAKFDYRLE